MKSYSDFINERAERDQTIVMRHTNIQGAKMPEDTANTSSLVLTDEQSKAVQKTPNRVSLQQIEDRIEFQDFENPKRHPHMTLCILTMKNGYIFIGKSTPADPLNFDAELGRKFAYEDAIRQIWPMEAYLLRENMTGGRGSYAKA